MGQVLEITLRIRCYNLPGATIGDHTAVRLGIQKRQEVIEDVPADSKEAVFLVPVRVEFKDSGAANFLGPFTHGTPKERFIYLCWGERVGVHWAGIGRVKLQLLPIPHTALFRAADTNSPLEVAINMTDDKGRPIYATVKEKQLSWES